MIPAGWRNAVPLAMLPHTEPLDGRLLKQRTCFRYQYDASVNVTVSVETIIEGCTLKVRVRKSMVNYYEHHPDK